MLVSVVMNSVNRNSALEMLLDRAARLLWASIAGPLVAVETVSRGLTSSCSPARCGWVGPRGCISATLSTALGAPANSLTWKIWCSTMPAAVLAWVQEILHIHRRIAGGAGASVMSQEGIADML